MSSIICFFIFIPVLAFILLAINLIFAPHNPYQEKNSAFECGYHSFLGQNRTQFSISFFIFALLFLLFDLEILLVYPYIVSAYSNSLYGLAVMLIFFLVLTLGFAFELGKKALSIDSKQVLSVTNKQTKIISSFNIVVASKPLYLNVYKKIVLVLSLTVITFIILYVLYFYYEKDILNYCNSIDIDVFHVIIIISIAWILQFIVIVLIGNILTNILKSKYILPKLPVKFKISLCVNTSYREKLGIIFSKPFFYFYLYYSSTMFLAYIILWCLNFTISFFSLLQFFALIFFTSLCINVCSCYVYKIKFLSIHNLCSFIYTFTLLFFSKAIVISTMPFIIQIPYFLSNDCSIFAGNNSLIDKFKTGGLTLIKEFLRKIPVVNKIMHKKIHTYTNNPSLGILRSKYNANLYKSNFIPVKPIYSFDWSSILIYKSRANYNSGILSAIKSLQVNKSCIMFTYNEKTDYIVIHKLSKINCENLNMYLIRLDEIGKLPKSGYFSKSSRSSIAIPPKITYPNRVLLDYNKNDYLFNETDSIFYKLSVLDKNRSELFNIKPNFDFDILQNSKKNLDNKIFNKEKNSLSAFFDLDNISPDHRNIIVNMNPYNQIYPNQGESSASATRNAGKTSDNEIYPNQSELSATRDTDKISGNQQVELWTKESSLDNITSNTDLEQLLDSYFFPKGQEWNDFLFVDLDTASRAVELLERADTIKPELVNLHRSCLEYIMEQYEYYFDEESGNSNDTLNGISEVMEYLLEEIKIVIDRITKGDVYFWDEYSEPEDENDIWKVLKFPSNKAYIAEIDKTLQVSFKHTMSRLSKSELALVRDKITADVIKNRKRELFMKPGRNYTKDGGGYKGPSDELKKFWLLKTREKNASKSFEAIQARREYQRARYTSASKASNQAEAMRRKAMRNNAEARKLRAENTIDLTL